MRECERMRYGRMVCGIKKGNVGAREGVVRRAGEKRQSKRADCLVSSDRSNNAGCWTDGEMGQTQHLQEKRRGD